VSRLLHASDSERKDLTTGAIDTERASRNQLATSDAHGETPPAYHSDCAISTAVGLAGGLGARFGECAKQLASEAVAMPDD